MSSPERLRPNTDFLAICDQPSIGALAAAGPLGYIRLTGSPAALSQ